MAKKALVLGISNYGAPNELTSCTRDAEAFAGVLESVYRFEHVRTLKDGDATRDSVDRALDWLFQGATANDRLAFFYSGHGYRYEKAGVLEEALVLQDGRLLDDDELAERMDGLPPGVLTIVLDCSFSDAAEKLLLLPGGEVEIAKAKRWTPLDAERRHHDRGQAGPKRFSPFGYVQPAPSEVVAAHFRTAPVLDPSSARVAALADPRSKALLVLACLEDETATAATSQTNGLSPFTFCLVNAVRRLGPNRSALEISQSAGLELARLGFRQTPIVKEPTQPEHLGLRAFLTFQPVLFVYSPPTPGLEPESHLTRSIAEAIHTTLSRTKEEPSMQTTATGQNLLSEDIGTIVNTVTPIVASVLQSRSSQPYGGGFTQLPFGFMPPMGQAHDIGQLASTITPLVLSLLQGRHQPFAMGGQPFYGQSPSGYGGGFPGAGWGGFQQGGMSGQPWGGFQQGGMGAQPWGGAYQAGMGGQSWGGFHGAGLGVQPHEIAQIVSAVVPVVASLLQSRSYAAQPWQSMPRAA